VDFICRQTDVEKIEDITRGMVNTHFKNWWRRKVWDSTTPDQLRVALRKFFVFLAENKGIVNEKVLKALQ
jgi:site-specific recombinase XerD